MPREQENEILVSDGKSDALENVDWSSSMPGVSYPAFHHLTHIILQSLLLTLICEEAVVLELHFLSFIATATATADAVHV